MKRLLLCLLPAALSAQQDDPLLKAMRDEIARAKQLKIANFEGPYFVQYTVDDGETFSVSATLGGLIGKGLSNMRLPQVQVRVGDYVFDNGNSIFYGFRNGSRYETGQLAKDADYAHIRREFWLATDRAYKSAVEGYSRKQAALKSVTSNEKLDDFTKLPPVKKTWDDKPEKADEAVWVERTKSLSKVFASYPAIIDSSVEFSGSNSFFYLVNTEGSEVKAPDHLAYVRARASALAPDGSVVRDHAVFQSLTLSGLPKEDAMRAGIDAAAKNVLALQKAPMGESYSGPVLFEAQASAQLFAQLFGNNLNMTRKPVSMPGRPISPPASELEGRIGSRVLPEWFDVTDDATKTEFKGHQLFGQYDVDLEGIPPMPFTIVEKGVLKNVLLTRTPVRGMQGLGVSGHARLPGSFGGNTAYFGNLFVHARETKKVKDLRKKFLDMVKARNKEYGLIIRKLDFPSSAGGEEIQRIAADLQRSGNTARPVSMPLLVYKVYPDGREELVRGLRFRNVNFKSLKDIALAGDDETAFDFIGNAATFSHMSAGGYLANATVTAPSVLFEDFELERPQEELPKPPIVPAPALASAK